LLAWGIACTDNAPFIRTLFLVTLLFVVHVPGPVGGGDPSPSRPVRSKSSREARAKANLEKIKPLINAGKYKTARRRLRKLIRDYPGTIAALEAGIIHVTLQDLAERPR
jgi:hypothetical protein